MAANTHIARSVFLESLDGCLSLYIDDYISPHVTDRPAPRARLEGPDIALSGRQILLKLLI